MSTPTFTFLNAAAGIEAKSGFVVSPAALGQKFAADFDLQIPVISKVSSTTVNCDLLKDFPVKTIENISFPLSGDEGNLYVDFKVTKEAFGISCSGTDVQFDKPEDIETATVTTLQSSTETSLQTYTKPVVTGMTGGVNFSFVADQTVIETGIVTVGILGPYLVGGTDKVKCTAAEITEDEAGNDVQTPVVIKTSSADQTKFTISAVFETTLNEGAKYAVTCPGASISLYSPIDLKSSYSYVIFGNNIQTFPVKLEAPTKTDDGTDGTDGTDSTSSSTVATTAAALIVAVSTVAAFFF